MTDRAYATNQKTAKKKKKKKKKKTEKKKEEGYGQTARIHTT